MNEISAVLFEEACKKVGRACVAFLTGGISSELREAGAVEIYDGPR